MKRWFLAHILTPLIKWRRGGKLYRVNGTDPVAYEDFTHGSSAFGVPLPATINFVKTRPLRDFLPTDLNTPESQEALAELNEAQKEAQTPPADR